MKDVNILITNGVEVYSSLELFGDMETYNATLQDFLEAVDKKMADIKRFKEMADMANYAILDLLVLQRLLIIMKWKVKQIILILFMNIMMNL